MRKGMTTSMLILLILGAIFVLFIIAWYALDLNVSLDNLLKGLGEKF